MGKFALLMYMSEFRLSRLGLTLGPPPSRLGRPAAVRNRVKGALQLLNQNRYG